MSLRKKLVVAIALLTIGCLMSSQLNVVASVKYKGKPSLTYEDIDWDVNSMSFSELLDYFAWNNASSCKITHDFGGKFIVQGTVAGYDGQRAVCLDRKMMPDPRKCLVLSFGMSQNWTFDKDMVEFGCDVHSFDSNVVKNETRWGYLHFYRLALGSVNKDGFKKDVPVRTLKTIYESLESNYSVIDYLKVDSIQVLPDIIASGVMDSVRQLSVKVNLRESDHLETIKQRAKVLKLIEEYGMVRFNSKPNLFSVVSFASATLKAPNSYDIAFYNSKLLRQSNL